jgi:hypothetical protein
MLRFTKNHFAAGYFLKTVPRESIYATLLTMSATLSSNFA